MKKIWLIAGSLALVIAIVGLSGCGRPISETASGINVNLNSQQEGIWVSGQGKVSVVPDVAIIRLGIEAQEASVAEAQSEASAAMDKVMTTLTDGGIAEKDIQTQYFNIQRVTRWDNDKQQEVVIGYRVTNVVTAKIREMGSIGMVIDAVATAGGDLTRIDSISFTVDDPSSYYGEARQKAIADAEAKAKQLADLSGVTLGKPTYVSESGQVPSPIYREDLVMKAAGAPAPETPISPGEIEITLSVQIAYSILE